MTIDKNAKRMKIKPSEIPLESSLGFLAIGDIAFTAWREVKKANNKKNSNTQKSEK